jgi:hypothetical protein
MKATYKAYCGRQRHSNKLIIEEVFPDGSIRFHVWDNLTPDLRRWFRLVAHDPLGYLRDAPQ